MQCSVCNAEFVFKTAPKRPAQLPPKWKRIESNCFCGKCWGQKFILRAVTIPVVGPVDATWPEFRAALRSGWAACTAATNWMLTEMYARDSRREGQAKLPPMPKIDLYREARSKFPSLPSKTVASLEHAVAAKYGSKRYAVLWTCEESLPNYRYPAPFIVPSQGWSADYENDQRPVIACRIGDRRFTLRLRGGKEFGRQLTAFRQIIKGEAIAGELALYRQLANSNDNRNGIADRDGGGAKQQYRIMAKMVAWLPRQAERELMGTLFVSNNADSLLFAVNAKANRIWQIHFDQVKRWIAEHRRQLQNWSDDSKMELGRGKRSFAKRREAASVKFRNRMQSAAKEAAAQIVNYAARNRFAKILWVAPVALTPEKFIWSILLDRIATKAEEFGITFEKGIGSDMPVNKNDNNTAEGE